jgi:hypothetical protein
MGRLRLGVKTNFVTCPRCGRLGNLRRVYCSCGERLVTSESPDGLPDTHDPRWGIKTYCVAALAGIGAVLSLSMWEYIAKNPPHFARTLKTPNWLAVGILAGTLVVSLMWLKLSNRKQ